MNIGDEIDDFALLDETGRTRRLSELLAGGPVVLFFYPVASSGGCTAEACHFRDLAAEFAELGARPVGISSDTVTAQRTFAGSHSLGYPLLSDPDHAVARRFGAWRWWLPAGMHTRRRTFVVDTDRRLLAQFGSEANFTMHADEALSVLRRTAA